MRKTLIAVLMMTSILAAACSSGNDDQSDSATEASTTGGSSLSGQVNDHGTETLSGDQIEVEMDDFYFSPTFVDAPAGESVTVELTNEGSATHTFTIDSLDIDVELGAGEQKSVEVTLPDDGQLVFYCRFHRGQGMEGAFQIQ